MFLRVLFLAAYDPMASQVTPVQFRNSLGLDALCLTFQSVDGGVYRMVREARFLQFPYQFPTRYLISRGMPAYAGPH